MQKSKIYPEDRSKSKILVIGHDPRLQTSNTIAEYCFFADYFFKPIPSRPQELRKYEFAKKLYSYISWLTSHKYVESQYAITNLCREELPRSADNKNKIILIPERCAVEGLKDIEDILKESKIEIIFAMSLQVNYWLQKLGFYSSASDFVKLSSPKKSYEDKGNYKETGKYPFLSICGKRYLAKGIPLFPILHVKLYPFKGNIKINYEKLHYKCIDSIKEMVK